MSVAPLAPQRRHTLFFLEQARAIAPVFLDTEVDMARVVVHRAAGRAAGRPVSPVTYLLYCAARVLAAHPEANAAIGGGRRPKVARYERVAGKVTFDKTLDGHRVVLTTVLPDLDAAPLEDIQRRLEHFRDGDPATMPELAKVRALHRMPIGLGRLAARMANRSLRRRAELMGTFAVTSLGHRPVDSFHSVGGTTVTLGMGRILDRPVARGGAVVIAPVMRLSLAFDHRVIDGAEAADVLAGIKDSLETFAPAEAAAPVEAGVAG
ncbi:2-oxo acid dehydrogenase subunit E2 [Dactylosporangium salmoneum]|uniref:2-oxoacid dehydrogenase acyltransferase catalytic domain-containing protein n=1 Tax=Dactylosporangium salmoneum TaxID=53361 RepID=A0ABP5T6U9_9ACTN